MPRLPRKSSLRCRKCHACHAKDRGATSVLLRRQASADLYGGTESTTPATQIEPEVPKVPRATQKTAAPHQSYFVAKLPLTSMVAQKVPRLPRKSSLRCRKCHATRNTAAPHQSYFVTTLPLTTMMVQKAPRLPRKSSLRCRKCHACHAKDRGATSVLLRRQASADNYDGPRLPRKCRKCHACHAKDRGATSVLLRRQASADLYGGTESTTPATQIEPEVPKAPRLPRKRPRRHISPTSSPSFR